MPPTTDRGVDVELAGGEIVEKKQRLGALHQHVVDAHADQIDADAVVPVQLLRQLQLGADAVGAGHQHRLAVLARQVEQRAESAQSAHHLGAVVRAPAVLMRSTSSLPASMSTPASR
jgi:hypothetical protein